MENDHEFIETITQDVLKVLEDVRFFQSLDDRLCSTDPAQPGSACRASYAVSTAILTDRGFDSEAVGEIIEVLKARGAHCDCEILFNIAEASRLKSEYWMSRAARYQHRDSHDLD